MKKCYRVTIDLVFEPEEKEDFEGINAKVLEDAINDGLGEDSYNFFGESICMAGLLTPTVKKVEEIK